ncbi:MAG: hypothetical protein IJA01_02980 [Firmicutes bacterium]|nr:hypothetical protein [Bacillota bacterium]
MRLFRKVKKTSANDKLIAEVAKNMCCSKRKAKAAMDDVKERLGVSYKSYVKYDFHLLSPEAQKKKAKRIEEKKANAQKIVAESVAKVAAATGEDPVVVKKKISEARKRTGIGFDEYAKYEFWKLSKEEQAAFYTRGVGNALTEKYNTNKEGRSIFANKSIFDKTFDKYLNRMWFFNKEITLEEFKEKMADQTRVIYKPIISSQGKGVEAFDVDQDKLDEMYEMFCSFPKGVVEECIVQHPEMARFSKNAVNTIRTVTIFKDDKVNIVYAAVKMGGGDSVVDNVHISGGVVTPLDVETGKVRHKASDFEGNLYTHHPVTGEYIMDLQVPFWDEYKEYMDKLCRVVDGINYIGWDIAISDKGPVVIEANFKPSPSLIQIPFFKERIGMKHIVEDYL